MGRAGVNKNWRSKQPAVPTCWICLKPIKHRNQLTKDHLIPKRFKGGNSYENIAPAHGSCNNIRGAFIDKLSLNLLHEITLGYELLKQQMNPRLRDSLRRFEDSLKRRNKR